MDTVATFQKLIRAFEEKFKNDNRVYALWLEGSYGGETYDEFSDIDIWMNVADESAMEIWTVIEALLTQFGKAELLISKPVTHNHEDRCYEIEGLPPTAHIDINVEKHSRVWWINEGDADPTLKVIFDKEQVINYRKSDIEIRKKEIKERAEQAYGFYSAYYKPGIIRNLKRGNYLETVCYYLSALEQLVVLVRLKYQPTKSDFWLKHITRDVPEDVQKQLADLYKFQSLEDLKNDLERLDKLVEEYANLRH